MAYLPKLTPTVGKGLGGLPKRTASNVLFRGDVLFLYSRQLIVPKGISEISVVCIAGGAGGALGPPKSFAALASGGAGGLAYTSNIKVKEGDVLFINVGRGGTGGIADETDSSAGAEGESSYLALNSIRLCEASGGTVSAANGFNGSVLKSLGGDVVIGDGGAQGGDGDTLLSTNELLSRGFCTGGGGAGYLGRGGNGQSGSNTDVSENNGVEDGMPSARTFSNGSHLFGSYGSSTNGPSTEYFYSSSGSTKDEAVNAAGLFGAGGNVKYDYHGSSTSENKVLAFGVAGAQGAVRIVWGKGRSFPSTDVGLI